MANISGGHLVAKYIKEVEKINTVFALSGGHIKSITDGLVKYGVRAIDVRHEQAGAMMATAWSIYTGQPGVCIVTAGPGFTNALTGVVNARFDNIPLVLIAGRHMVKDDLKGALQEMYQVEMIRPVVKWAATCYETKRIPEFLATAFAQAIEGRPGPVFLELPLDIVGVSVPEEAAPMPTRATPKFTIHPDDEDLKRAAEIINAAQKPLFLGGSGVTFSDCEVALKAFLEKTGIPFQLHNYGRGVVPDTHPLSLMDAGFTGLMLALSQADVIIAAGIRFNWIFQSGQAISPQAKIVRIDIEPTEINRNRVAAAGLVGDVGSVLNQLSPFVQKRDHSAWINTLRRAYLAFIDTELKLREKPSDPIHPIRLVEQIQKAMGDNTLFVTDGGDTCYWAIAGFRATEKAGMVVGTGGLFGCLGTGIPFAIAAKLARPDKKVLLLNGDGSFGLNAMEFDTAVRHNIPFVCVVNNDCSWGMVKHDQELSLGKECLSCVSLPLIHYEKMVEGLGGYGEFVTKDEEIIPAIQRALKSGKPACVNVITDPTAVSPASLAFYVSLKVD